MKRDVLTTIDTDLCKGCRRCVEVCPHEVFEVIEGKARVVGTESMHCGQCAAVCPEDAITVAGVTPVTLDGIEPGSGVERLSNLLAMRRSCRLYKDKAVDKRTLENLVRAGTLAPSGTNSQRWTFSIVPDREGVIALAQTVSRFYERINRMAKNPGMRLFSKWFMGDALGTYYREYYDRVQQALDEWRDHRRDRLFHGATAVILVGMKPDASCPVEDASMASQNIVLAAEAMGLGTCLIGFAVEAMKRDPSIGLRLGIPGDEKVHAVIAVGHPKLRFARPAGRMAPTVRFV